MITMDFKRKKGLLILLLNSNTQISVLILIGNFILKEKYLNQILNINFA